VLEEELRVLCGYVDYGKLVGVGGCSVLGGWGRCATGGGGAGDVLGDATTLWARRRRRAPGARHRPRCGGAVVVVDVDRMSFRRRLPQPHFPSLPPLRLARRDLSAAAAVTPSPVERGGGGRGGGSSGDDHLCTSSAMQGGGGGETGECRQERRRRRHVGLRASDAVTG